ncbi:MAG TPA: pitrilysin family protein [Steroidobacteraceae bacterium]|nr:pitrilysin family protein [Steroidobacteraceae bacterium]
MRRFAAVALALVAWAAAAEAREQPPAPGEPRDFRLPARETIALDNGLAVTFIDYGAVPKVTVLAVVRTGNIDDGDATWLADVTVEMMKEGTATRSAPAIAEAAAGMGGALNVGAGAEQATFGISVLSEHGAEAVQLVADVLRNPAFPDSELPRVVANFERSLAVARSDPQSLAGEALARLVYGDHPFGRAFPQPGRLADYGIDALRRFHAQNFGARRTHVYVAGRYDRAALEAALRRSLGDWRAGAPPSVLPAAPAESLQLALIDTPAAPQSSIRIAVPVPHPAHALYFPTTIMNSLLGGAFGSRITANIREDKGYSYSPDSSLSARRGTALWVLSAEVTTEHTADALAEIYQEIDRLQREPPPAAELDAIKAYRSGLFVISNSSPNGVLGQFAFMDLHGLPPEFLARWVASVHAVTPAQVSEMAARFIVPSRMTVVVAGDLARVAADVQALPQLSGAPMP